jgi:predicted metal-dependent peptidase
MEILKKPREIHATEVSLTGQQTKLWDQSRAKFMLSCPAFCHILYQMMNPRRQEKHAVFTHDVPIAGTDGLYMYLNPERWFKYTLGERCFIMAHEVLHAIFNHCIIFHMYRTREHVKFSDGTQLPYVEIVMQLAADCVINAIIRDSAFDGFAVPADAQFQDDITSEDQLIEAYRKVFKQTKGGKKLPGDGKPGEGGPSNGFDVHLEPGSTEGKPGTVAAQDRNEQEWKIAVSAAIALAKAQGNLPGTLARVLEDVLDPQVSWQDYVEGWCKRKAGGGSFNFRRPDRRLISREVPIYAPARSGFGVNNMVVVVDTSGSITDPTISMFFAEMKGVLEDVKPEHMFVIWCDAKVHRIDYIEDMSDLLALRRKDAPGGGGTSFVPPFDTVRDDLGITPDALIYLTDGDGTFPAAAPSYPVLWGTIKKNNYPWGEVVEIPQVQ